MTSPEALREAVERLTSEADNPTGWKWDLSEPEGVRHDTSVVRCADLRTLLSALQEAREALEDAREYAMHAIDCATWVPFGKRECDCGFDETFHAAEARALSPGGADE